MPFWLSETVYGDGYILLISRTGLMSCVSRRQVQTPSRATRSLGSLSGVVRRGMFVTFLNSSIMQFYSLKILSNSAKFYLLVENYSLLCCKCQILC